MSRSWLYGRPLLYENAYGHHAAIHSFYLMLAFSPLTIPWGAYGLFAGLLALELLAVWRIASSSLDLAARVVVLAGLTSPLAYLVFDDPEWGFHPELCYPPLAVLLALDLLDGRHRRALLPALALLLVKEDGAALVAAVLIAWFAARLWSLAPGARAERRRLLRTALLSLAAVAAVLALNLALLWALGRGLPPDQATASGRVARGLSLLWGALSGRASAARRWALVSGLFSYLLYSLVLLVPLGARAVRGLGLLAPSLLPVLLTLALSATPYRFAMMEWAPRIALLLGLLLACLVFAARPGGSLRTTAALVLLSWGLQLPLLDRLGYPLFGRAAAWSLAGGTEPRLPRLPERELRLLRCVAGRLPRNTSVSPVPEAYPLFQHHSIVFQGLDARAWRPPRLRMVPPEPIESAGGGGVCPGPRVGGVVLQVDCELLPLVASCGIVADAPAR